jgi:hypothetical protein
MPEWRIFRPGLYLAVSKIRKKGADMPAQYPALILCLILIAGLATTSAHAAGPEYRCTITQRYAAAPETPAVQKAQEKAHIGKQFTVEKETGIMSGALMNAYAVEPVIIDEGSSESAYKVVTAMKKDDGAGFGSNLYALTINEQDKSDMKPFAFLENDKVYLGHCKLI